MTTLQQGGAPNVSVATPTPIGGFKAGVTSTGQFTDIFLDGVVMDYYNSTARFTTDVADGFGWYNGNFVTPGIPTTNLMNLDAQGNLQVVAANTWNYAPNPTSIAAVTTLTGPQVAAGIINTTGTSYTVTMPTGSTLDTQYPNMGVNVAMQFSVVNTASGTITMAANTGVTTLGTLTIATATSALFALRRTAAATYVLYRLV